MSHRHEQTRKGRQAKTPRQLRQKYTRDLRFCERWDISIADAWKWACYPLRNYTP